MIARAFCLLSALLIVAACASPPDLAKAPLATPPVLAAFRGDPPVKTAVDWQRRVPLLRNALQDAIYGHAPDLGAAVVEDRKPLDLPDVGGAQVEQWTVRLGEASAGRRFHMVVATPKGASHAPLIVMELFCSARSAIPGHPDSVFENKADLPAPCRSHTLDPLLTVILGRLRAGPSIAQVTARGYAVAMFYPGEIAPDDPDVGPPALERLQPGVQASERAGALAIWAELFSKAYEVLSVDPRVDPARVAIWGHSRHGKASLLAAALDTRFAAVISHQSGRGGASLTRSPAGESLKEINDKYGYWFKASFAGGVPADLDQHDLIALIAPRPVLLGSGSGDAWSDPAGAWRAAQGADPAYRLLGSRGFTAKALKDSFDPSAGIVWWSRPKGHGVTTADWNAFLQFLDMALAPKAQPSP